MTTITLPRATVEQALEALELVTDLTNHDDEIYEAITALRAALAQQAEPVEDLIPPESLFVCDQMGAHVTRVRLAQQAEPATCSNTFGCRCPKHFAVEQAEPVEPVESALQAVAEKIGDQCAVWYGIGARDVEAVLREAARYGLVHGAQAEPVEPVAIADGTFNHDCPIGTLLYTAPPQRKPLPKHDQHCVDVPGYGLMAVRLVRAVERAHGITDPQIEDRLARHGIPMPEGDPK